ncbi:hypothetical protein HUU53_04715 [Candidatus Micrarchaeota archaeon]|nr:hypothetical protein [Candidatus Micrarchaeota archaeon]
MFNYLSSSKTFNIFIGASFLVFGALFLLSNFGYIPEIDFQKIWPVIFVVLGLTFLIKAFASKPPQQQGEFWQ